MEIDKLKIDDDLVEYLSEKIDKDNFINECVRRQMQKEKPSMYHSSTSTTVNAPNMLNQKDTTTSKIDN